MNKAAKIIFFKYSNKELTAKKNIYKKCDIVTLSSLGL